MNDDNVPPALPPSRFILYCQRSGTAAKMVAVLVLLLLLLIPLNRIESVLQERMQRRSQAISEITSTWGNEQELAGPMRPYLSNETGIQDAGTRHWGSSPPCRIQIRC